MTYLIEKTFNAVLFYKDKDAATESSHALQ